MQEVCKKCGGQGVIEVYEPEPELGFEVMKACPECDKEIENSLRDFLEAIK